jgi:hypothetical protein
VPVAGVAGCAAGGSEGGVLESSARPEGAATATSNTASVAEITILEIVSFIGQFPHYGPVKNGPLKTTVMDRDCLAMEKKLAANYRAALQTRIFFENRR